MDRLVVAYADFLLQAARKSPSIPSWDDTFMLTLMNGFQLLNKNLTYVLLGHRRRASTSSKHATVA
jgi:hypothetical protein